MTGPFGWETLFAGGLVMMAVVFAGVWWLARRIDNLGVADVAWGYALALLVGFYALMGGGDPGHRAVAAGMAVVWGLRLGIAAGRRVAMLHPAEDARYVALRQRWDRNLPLKLFLCYQGHALALVALAVPFLLVCVDGESTWSGWEWVGLFVWAGGVGGEAVADAQLAGFKARHGRAEVCDRGLWRFSRHPNYFFEFVAWVGVYLFAVGTPGGWTTVHAPVLIFFLLLKVSGVPSNERCALQSKGDAYRRYQRVTNRFWPGPAAGPD